MGGVAGGVAATATVVGKAAGTKVADVAVARAGSIGQPKPSTVDAGELKVVRVHEATPPSRIEVDSRGVATARRKPAPVVHDISSLPQRTPPMSSRAIERRRQLEALKPKELASR